jgi:hypothetical protein
MTIGIITLHGSHNYGAMLQVYALKTYLSTTGHTAHVINLHSLWADSFNRQISFTSNIKRNLKSLLACLHKEEWDTRYRRFESFKDEHMSLTKRYCSYPELAANPPPFDVYVCGSDQIWNPELEFAKEFFLEFGPATTRRVSYAASFGVETASLEKIGELNVLLKKFDAISVREMSGVSIVRDSGYHADLVLDPTLLLDRDTWSIMFTPPQTKEKYIFSYSLEYSEEYMKNLTDVSRYMNLPICAIETSVRSKYPRMVNLVRNAGPIEFLSLLSGAELIFTNSFHGTAFSLNMGRPLVSVRHSSRNSRMDTLLSTVGWENSQLHHCSGIKHSCDLAHERASAVDGKRLDHIRLSSTEFIRKHITGNQKISSCDSPAGNQRPNSRAESR